MANTGRMAVGISNNAVSFIHINTTDADTFKDGVRVLNDTATGMIGAMTIPFTASVLMKTGTDLVIKLQAPNFVPPSLGKRVGILSVESGSIEITIDVDGTYDPGNPDPSKLLTPAAAPIVTFFS